VELQRHIDRSGLHDRIVFHGHVHDTEQCYYGFDVLLLPSRDDPFPLCVLEAMSFGKLCMGFDSGGFIEQVGDTGMPVRPMSAEALAAACMRVIHEPALLARGQKAWWKQ
jgi:glycosyltransferase involved in cell wall biosynthesis